MFGKQTMLSQYFIWKTYLLKDYIYLEMRLHLCLTLWIQGMELCWQNSIAIALSQVGKEGERGGECVWCSLTFCLFDPIFNLLLLLLLQCLGQQANLHYRFCSLEVKIVSRHHKDNFFLLLSKRANPMPCFLHSASSNESIFPPA